MQPVGTSEASSNICVLECWSHGGELGRTARVLLAEHAVHVGTNQSVFTSEVYNWHIYRTISTSLSPVCRQVFAVLLYHLELAGFGTVGGSGLPVRIGVTDLTVCLK